MAGWELWDDLLDIPEEGITPPAKGRQMFRQHESAPPTPSTTAGEYSRLSQPRTRSVLTKDVVNAFATSYDRDPWTPVGPGYGWSPSAPREWCPFRSILGMGGDAFANVRSRSRRSDGTPQILDLPIEAVLKIFTIAGGNLLAGASLCSRVHPDFWFCLRSTTACGVGVVDRSVLSHISCAMGKGELLLSGVALGDAGSKALGAAMSALPVDAATPQVLDLTQTDLTAEGMATIAEAMVRQRRTRPYTSSSTMYTICHCL